MPKWGLRSGDFVGYIEGFKSEDVPKPHRLIRTGNDEMSDKPPRPKLTAIDRAVNALVRLVLFSITAAVLALLWNFVLVDACTIFKPVGFFGGCGLVIFFNLIKNLGRFTPK